MTEESSNQKAITTDNPTYILAVGWYRKQDLIYCIPTMVAMIIALYIPNDWTVAQTQKLAMRYEEKPSLHILKRIEGRIKLYFGPVIKFTPYSQTYQHCLFKLKWKQITPMYIGVLVDGILPYAQVNIIKQKLKNWIINHNRFNQFGEELNVDIHKWRSMTARFVFEAVQELESMENLNVLIMSWHNVGIYLDLSGTQDGDINP